MMQASEHFGKIVLQVSLNFHLSEGSPIIEPPIAAFDEYASSVLQSKGPRVCATKEDPSAMAEYQYTAVFEPAPEGGFVVTVPALPGLVTEGDTMEEARAMVRDAIRGYSREPGAARRRNPGGTQPREH
jgi:predicted RNase H-like HicB family nuclease